MIVLIYIYIQKNIVENNWPRLQIKYKVIQKYVNNQIIKLPNKKMFKKVNVSF